MEIEQNSFDKLSSFIHQARENDNYELEARLGGRNTSLQIDLDSYTRVFKRLTYKKENNGFGLNYKMENILDVIIKSGFNEQSEFDTMRTSIIGQADIKKYWLFNNFNEIDMNNVKIIEKEKLDKFDDSNYPIRYSLNDEKTEDSINQRNKNLIFNEEQSKDVQKVFRLKNRYSIYSNDNLFSFDLTTIKTGYGTNFKDSNTMKAIPTFEIEVEFIKKDSELSDEDIAKNLLTYCGTILSTLQNNDNILKESLIRKVIEGYVNLVKRTNRFMTYDNPDFIAANPVTFHRTNFIKSSDKNKVNIYNKYAATLKADGERHFLYVMRSEDSNENGKIFLFDTNYNVKDTGFVCTSCTNTLIEGELIEIGEGREFFMYDLLFYRGQDMRDRKLINIKSGSKDSESRLKLLNEFFDAHKTIDTLNGYNTSNTIPLVKKEYVFLVSPLDNYDEKELICERIKSLWNNRKTQRFNSDGIIFVPIEEAYPTKGGSWKLLLKWKPPELNTIDFLIRTVKTEDGKDIRVPHWDIYKLPGEQIQKQLYQYKSVKLYVGSYRFDKGKKRIPIPIEFNPDGVNDDKASVYNVANIKLNDEDRMLAIDPFTQKEEVLLDDTVVEFGYDESQQEGFKWKPYRHRKDKTIQYKAGKKIANNEKTAIDVFNSIRYPVTEEMLLTGDIPIDEEGAVQAVVPYFKDIDENNENSRKKMRLAYQDFHNLFIKFNLFYVTSPAVQDTGFRGVKGRILDLCSGKGVDINKIAKARYNELVGIEIDEANVRFSKKYYFQMSPTVKPKRAFFIHGDSGKLIFPNRDCGFTEYDKTKLKEYIPTQYMFDTVSMMFCIHYLFENEIKLRSLLQNVTDNLKVGGYFVGTTFDGERIYNALKNRSHIQGLRDDGELMWKIEKKYKGTLQFKGNKLYGQKIDVLIGSIGNVWPENLVSFPFFEKIMEEYGFKKIFVKPFKEFYDTLITEESIDGMEDHDLNYLKDKVNEMSEEEKNLSFFYNAFVFIKVNNAPDKLLKDLIRIMKKEQVKRDTVDGETGEVIYDLVPEETEELILSVQKEDKGNEAVTSMVDSIADTVANKVLTKVAEKVKNSVKKDNNNVMVNTNNNQNSNINILNQTNSGKPFDGLPVNDGTKIEYVDNEGNTEKEEEVNPDAFDEVDSEEIEDDDLSDSDSSYNEV